MDQASCGFASGFGSDVTAVDVTSLNALDHASPDAAPNGLIYDFSKWIFSLTFLTGGKNIGLGMYIMNCKVFKMHSVAIENCVIQKRI